MRRGCDRIRVGSIAAKLSVSWRSRRCINSRAECAAGHRDIPHRFRPQSAQVEWSKKVRHGLGYGEGRNTSTSSAAKISSAEGSGGHVIKWRILGPDRFLFLYVNGLECFGYRQSPLEAMAYDAETAFASSMAIFNVLAI